VLFAAPIAMVFFPCMLHMRWGVIQGGRIMVQEVRDILLSSNEVFYAYESYARITPDFMPNSKFVSCAIKNGTFVLTVDKTDDTQPQRQEISFKGIDILKPLIRFCIENNIMLPRDGKKTVEIRDDKIVLRVELDLGADMPTSLSPLHMNHLETPPKRVIKNN
jgi:hypothetical protein